jgi:hypothetical protein
MYTKEMAQQNREVNARAKELLGDATGMVNDYPEIKDQLIEEYHNIKPDRLTYQMVKVLRSNNRGAEVRGRKKEPSKRGPKPMPDEEKRKKDNIYFLPGTKGKANIVLNMFYDHFDKDARKDPGWGHVVDDAIKLLHHLATEGEDIPTLVKAVEDGEKVKVMWGPLR